MSDRWTAEPPPRWALTVAKAHRELVEIESDRMLRDFDPTTPKYPEGYFWTSEAELSRANERLLNVAVNPTYLEGCPPTADPFLWAISKYQEQEPAGQIAAAIDNGELNVFILDDTGEPRHIDPHEWKSQGSDQRRTISIGVFMGDAGLGDGLHGKTVLFDRVEWGNWIGRRVQTKELTGDPGRPTSRHLYMGEFERRVAAGQGAASVKQEARYLADWLATQHPFQRPATAKSIENRIRQPFKAAKQKT